MYASLRLFSIGNLTGKKALFFVSFLPQRSYSSQLRGGKKAIYLFFEKGRHLINKNFFAFQQALLSFCQALPFGLSA